MRRWIWAILAVLTGCIPASDPAPRSDAGDLSCNADVYDAACCDDPDYRDRWLAECDTRAYAEAQEEAIETARSYTHARRKPQSPDVLRQCDVSVSEVVHICHDEAEPYTSCSWGAVYLYPDNEASVWVTRCGCIPPDHFENIRDQDC